MFTTPKIHFFWREGIYVAQHSLSTRIGARSSKQILCRLLIREAIRKGELG
jgi:hypothetical protein